METESNTISSTECNACKHSLIDNGHGLDQNDMWMEGDELVFSGHCTYCKECSPALKEKVPNDPDGRGRALKLTPEGEAAALSAIELSHRHNCGDENCNHTVQGEVDNPTGAPPMLPEKLTKKQIGALRRAHITVTHGSVIKCGHKAKFGPTKTPGNNCVSCWEAFFKTAVDLEALHTLVTTEGPKGMEKKYGKKFMRNFHGFLATELMRSPALPKPSTEGFNIPNLEESIPNEHREEVQEVTA